MEGIGFPAPGEPWPKPGDAPDPLGRRRRDLRNVGSLDLVFHVPGTLLKPEHTGLRTGRFSRKERMLQIQIAVPEDPMESPGLRGYIVQSIRRAVGIASRHRGHAPSEGLSALGATISQGALSLEEAA
jgi:hypothetical protein